MSECSLFHPISSPIIAPAQIRLWSVDSARSTDPKSACVSVLRGHLRSVLGVAAAGPETLVRRAKTDLVLI